MSNIKGTVATNKLVGNMYAVLGRDGLSAYEIALQNGFEGTEQEWLASLKGADGTMSFEDLTEEQKASLKGEKGSSGVYVGSGDMPEDCNVQIDPNGDTPTLDDINSAIQTILSFKNLKTISGVDVLVDEGSNILSNVSLKSNAPAGTKVKIYNKNYVGENELVGKVFQLETEDLLYGAFIYNRDSAGGVIADTSVANGGAFTFKGTIQTPPEFAHYVSSELSIYIEGFGEYRIPVGALEVGDTYKFFVETDVDQIRDKDGAVTEYIHTVKNIVLVNITKAITETVNADGTVNSSGINSFTLITHESEIPYDFELTYTVVDFATRKYVDDIVGDLETLLGGI